MKWLLLIALFLSFAQAEPVVEVDELAWEDLVEESSQFLPNLREQGLIYENETVQHWIDSVLTIITTTAKEDRSNFRVVMLKEEEAGAFSIPDGTIYLTTGIFPYIQSESQLAFVFSHEVAHVVLKHHLGNMHEYHEKSHSAAASQLAVNIFTGINWDPAYYIQYAMKGFNHGTERQADSLGLVWINSCGYSIPKALSFFQMLYDYEDPEGRDQESMTHPALKARIAAGKKQFGLKTLIAPTPTEVADIYSRTAGASWSALSAASDLNDSTGSGAILTIMEKSAPSAAAVSFWKARKMQESETGCDTIKVINLLSACLHDPVYLKPATRELFCLFLKKGDLERARKMADDNPMFATDSELASLVRYYLKGVKK